MVERGKETSNELSRLMSKAYLRRTKEEVLQDELPEKDERIVFCELSDLQKRIYQNMLELADMKMLRLSADPCDCGINKPFFKYLKKMTRKKEKLELLRANKKRIRRRAQCCYRTPIISLEDKRINPNALIWRSMHENDVPCDPLQRPTCPYCVLFPVMSRLMKVASHVALIQPMENPENLDDPKKQEEAAKELAFARAFIPRDCVPDLPGGSYIRQNSICNDHFSLSGKMKVLHRLLTRIEEKGGRVLVFSASTQTLDLIQDYLKSRGKSFLRMDGSTDREQRKELADEFSRNRGILVFLLSTRAMGLGLNLTSANYGKSSGLFLSYMKRNCWLLLTVLD
jgi:SNF2 family DNA or RNA helicase